MLASKSTRKEILTESSISVYLFLVVTFIDGTQIAADFLAHRAN
jgi:hypothetical protein